MVASCICSTYGMWPMNWFKLARPSSLNVCNKFKNEAKDKTVKTKQRTELA